MKTLSGVFLLIFLFHSSGTAQEKTEPFEKVRFEKAIINGEEASKFFRKIIHYPFSALNSHIDGNVFVSFIIDKTGQIDSLRILNEPDEVFESEVLNALSNSSGLWVPAMFDGIALYKKYIAAFNFTSSNAFQFKKDKSFRYYKRGNLMKALKVIDEAIKIDPYDIELYKARSLIYKKQKKYDLEILDQAKCYELNRDILIDIWFLSNY